MASSTKLEHFTCFPALPPELRRMIWRFCLPRRVLELDLRFSSGIYSDCDQDEQTTRLNRQLPRAIPQVNREARDVTLGLRQKLGWEELTGPPPDNASFFPENFPRPCFDVLQTSYVHLHWMMGPEAPVRTLEALKFLLWATASTANGLPSLKGHVLDKINGSPLLAPIKRAAADALRQRNVWIVHYHEPIIVHTDVRTAIESGLFGLQGDERVQIVKLTERSRLARFQALLHSAKKKMDLPALADDLEAQAEYLDDLVKSICETDGKDDHDMRPLPRLQPAVMIRLCVRPCRGWQARFIAVQQRKEEALQREFEPGRREGDEVPPGLKGVSAYTLGR
jgi:hypothetical protein